MIAAVRRGHPGQSFPEQGQAPGLQEPWMNEETNNTRILSIGGRNSGNPVNRQFAQYAARQFGNADISVPGV